METTVEQVIGIWWDDVTEDDLEYFADMFWYQSYEELSYDDMIIDLEQVTSINEFTEWAVAYDVEYIEDFTDFMNEEAVSYEYFSYFIDAIDVTTADFLGVFDL